MILSNVEIQRALDEGRLVLDPEPAPRLPTRDGPECPFQTSAVDLRLGDELLILKQSLPVAIDLTAPGKYANFAEAVEEKWTFPVDQPFTLEPGRFVLGKTLERVDLPINNGSPCLAARIEGRSSYARCGLLVHFTAPTIHAGFSGVITLEIMNLGPYRINLYKHKPICQLIIEEVEGSPFRNDSQFQGQVRPGGVPN